MILAQRSLKLKELEKFHTILASLRVQCDQSLIKLDINSIIKLFSNILKSSLIEFVIG